MSYDHRVSVVIPTLNEEGSIEECLESVGDEPGIGVVVSDGGSRDRTCDIVRRSDGVRLVTGASGRGAQMNRGAADSSGEIVLFLHADCRLPAGWLEMVEEAHADERVSLSCFRLVTEPSSPTGRLGRGWLRLIDLRSRGRRLPYGDQAFALRTTTFRRLGGFPEIPLMEDLVFARTCRHAGLIRRIAAPVRTTARRVERRPIATHLMWLSFPWLYWAGVAPERLARWYGAAR
jgi:rSAM/selenodomain-associated transferase 2